MNTSLKTVRNRLFSTVDKIYSNIIPSVIAATVIQELPLSASNISKKTEKTEEYKIHATSIPYNGAAVSLGIKIFADFYLTQTNSLYLIYKI